MQPSRFYQVLVPDFVQGGDTPAIARGTNSPMRVQVRNSSPVEIFLSDTQTDLTSTNAPSGSVYRLPAGERDVFVMAPNQNLYAVAAGAGAFLSISLSEALLSD
jgi:hypothetical protein